MTNNIETRLKELGIELPESNPPAANYLPYSKTGNLVFISGQTCRWKGEMKYAGKVGSDYNLEEAQESAKLCGLNILAQLKSACNGDLDKVNKCVKLNIFINSTDDFQKQALVANGVSDLMVDVFGDKGRHARAAVGVNVLPSNSAVEVEAVFELSE